MTKSATAAAETRQPNEATVEEQSAAEVRRLVTPRLIESAREAGEGFPLIEALVLAKWLRAGEWSAGGWSPDPMVGALEALIGDGAVGG